MYQKKRIKVLALIWSMGQGGAEQIVINNLRDLTEDPDIEFKVCVFCAPNGSKFDGEIEEKHYPVRYLNYPKSHIRIPYIRAPFNLRIARKAFAQVIAEERPDIVHVHIDELLDKCLYGILKNNVPVRFDTLHSNPLRNQGRVLKTIQRAFQKEDFIALCLNRAQYETARPYYGIQRYEILRNGVDFASIRERIVTKEAARNRLHIPQDAFLIVFVGRLSPIKNIPLLLDAFRVVLAEKKDAMLVLAGDGPDRRELEQKCEMDGTLASVRFLGNLCDVTPVYCAADVMALPSASEASSLVLLEAQCCGARCVISSGCPEESIISDCVQRLPEGADAEAWASALLDAECRGQAVCCEDDYEVHRQSALLKQYYLNYYRERVIDEVADDTDAGDMK